MCLCAHANTYTKVSRKHKNAHINIVFRPYDHTQYKLQRDCFTSRSIATELNIAITVKFLNPFFRTDR